MLAKTFSALAVSAYAASWDYNNMGSDWGTDYPLCSNGREQSPVNLNSDGMESNAMMHITGFDYANYDNLGITDSGHTLITAIEEGEFHVTFPNGETAEFVPAQFHWHSPSEHTVDGVTYDVELHIVHTYKDGSLGGVIGIFFDVGTGGSSTNAFINEIAPQTAGPYGTAIGPVNFLNFLKGLDFSTYYSYDGSLTTPPCTEGIKWSVLADVQPISTNQVTAFRNFWSSNAAFAGGNGNNRATQPWNDRVVSFSDGVAFTSDPYKNHLDSGATVLGASAAFATILMSIY